MATVSPVAADKGVAEARPRRYSGSGRATVAVALIGALVIAVHLLVRTEGPRWASPLVMGEWLFTVCLAVAILIVALALGRTLARPLLGQDDALADQFAALGIGVGSLSLGMLSLGVLHLYYPPLILAALVVLALALRGEIASLWREGARLASSRVAARRAEALT